MYDFVTDVDFPDLLDDITEFIDTFFNDVMNADMVGLILYLWGCIPSFIRTFMVVAVMLAVVVAVLNVIRRD